MKIHQTLLKQYFCTLFIIFTMIIFTFAQEEYDAYEYADDGEYIDGDYEYADDGEYIDGDYEYADDGDYEYADDGEYIDGDYEYTDVGVEDNGEYVVDAGVEDDNVEVVGVEDNVEMPTEAINIIVPLFTSYRLPITIDPKNPVLPATHNITKLRSTVWRSDDVVLRTNKGVVSEQRLYLFFDNKKDALSYQYISAYTKNMPSFPSGETFIPLFPLLVSNDYVPVLVDKSPAPKIPPLEGNVRYMVNPSLSRNYDYGAVLEAMRQKALENLQEPGAFTTVNSNMVVITNTSIPQSNQSNKTKMVVTTNQVVSIITNIITISNRISAEQPKIINPQTNDLKGMESNTRQKSTQDDSFNTKELTSSRDFYNTLSYLPQFFVAQDMVAQNSPQYIINIGGNMGGIFIHETGDSEKPYKVIFLSLDEGMTLYEYNIDNSFDVRDGTLDASQRARELYIRILNEKINMKKFKRVLYKNYLN